MNPIIQRSIAYLKNVAKYMLLHLGIMHSDRTAPNFNPVENKIIVLASNLSSPPRAVRCFDVRFITCYSLEFQSEMNEISPEICGAEARVGSQEDA